MWKIRFIYLSHFFKKFVVLPFSIPFWWSLNSSTFIDSRRHSLKKNSVRVNIIKENKLFYINFLHLIKTFSEKLAKWVHHLIVSTRKIAFNWVNSVQVMKNKYWRIRFWSSFSCMGGFGTFVWMHYLHYNLLLNFMGCKGAPCFWKRLVE